MLNEASHHENVWGSGSIAPHILKLGTRCVYYQLRLLRKSPRHPLEKSLGGPQSLSGSGGKEKRIPEK